MLSAVIDAEEGREVAIADVPNAFVQTKLQDEDDKVVMRLQGPLAHLLCELAPEVYKPFMMKDKHGRDLLYVRILNALYGIMKAALLYYRCFLGDIKSEGFELNPYDPCIANKIVAGHQLTLLWHVDDIKMSHLDKPVIDEFIQWLRNTYECIFPDGSGAMRIS